ncbi:ribonuclease H-like protein [Hortaea werneckii]|nr:ribonuclease H-like protein [Hortaea werneckii]
MLVYARFKRSLLGMKSIPRHVNTWIGFYGLRSGPRRRLSAHSTRLIAIPHPTLPRPSTPHRSLHLLTTRLPPPHGLQLVIVVLPPSLHRRRRCRNSSHYTTLPALDLRPASGRHRRENHSFFVVGVDGGREDGLRHEEPLDRVLLDPVADAEGREFEGREDGRVLGVLLRWRVASSAADAGPDLEVFSHNENSPTSRLLRPLSSARLSLLLLSPASPPRVGRDVFFHAIARTGRRMRSSVSNGRPRMERRGWVLNWVHTKEDPSKIKDSVYAWGIIQKNPVNFILSSGSDPSGQSTLQGAPLASNNSFAVPQLNLHSLPHPNTGSIFPFIQLLHLASEGYPEPHPTVSFSSSAATPSPRYVLHSTSSATSLVTFATTDAAETQGNRLSAFFSTLAGGPMVSIYTSLTLTPRSSTFWIRAIVADMACSFRFEAPVERSWAEEMSWAESERMAQPVAACRSVPGVQRVCMRAERTVGVRALESSKWWVSARRERCWDRGRPSSCFVHSQYTFRTHIGLDSVGDRRQMGIAVAREHAGGVDRRRHESMTGGCFVMDILRVDLVALRLFHGTVASQTQTTSSLLIETPSSNHRGYHAAVNSLMSSTNSTTTTVITITSSTSTTTIPLPHPPQLQQPTPPRRRIFRRIVPRRPHQRDNTLIEGEIPDKTRERSAGNRALVHGGGDVGIIRASDDLDGVEALAFIRLLGDGAGFDEARARRGRDDDVDVGQLAGEDVVQGLVVEHAAGVVEDDVDVVVADVAFLAADHLGDLVVPDGRVFAVGVFRAVEALGVEFCVFKTLERAEIFDELAIVG